MTGQAAITVLGIFAGSATIIIVALVGFIGRDLKVQIKNLETVIFKEMEKRQLTKICEIEMAHAEKDRKDIKRDIDNVARIARGESAGS